MNYIRFWQASGESIKTSVRIKTRMKQLVEEGAYTGGNVLYGYKTVKTGQLNKKGKEIHQIEIEPEEAEIVKVIFEKTIKDGLGSHRLAKFLNEQGIRTHQGNKFQSNTINRILKNKSYCGYVISGGNCSPFISRLKIIDENIFDSVQNIISQRIAKNSKRTIPLNTKGKTLLSGNIFCAHCGGRLIVTRYQDRYLRKDGTEYKIDQLKYTCYHKTRKLTNCDGQTSYVAETIDNAVINVLDNLLKRIKETPKDKALEKKYKSQVSVYNSKYKKVNAEIDKLSNQLKSLKMEIGKALVGESVFTADQLSEAINTTQSRVNEKVLEQEKLKNEFENKQEAMSKLDYHYNRFLNWADEFQNASLEERKMIACQLIRQVKVSKGYNVNIEFDMDYQQFCEGL